MTKTEPVPVGLSLMPGEEYWQVAQPLFEKNEVEIVEWSFDIGWGRTLPDWLLSILSDFSQRERLLGHGVSYSALDASDTHRQEHWLARLAVEVNQFRYQHISEHFGFMGGGNFHLAAPLPVPRTPASIAVGQDRLRRLASVAQVPVGLENLAFAFGPNDVEQQGPFLDELLEPVDGFLLLDLHNLYCQSVNFKVDLLELLKGYPLNRVRELHISGGSWTAPGSPETPIYGDNTEADSDKKAESLLRRDTHDDLVPEEIFTALPAVIQQCPNLKAVMLERLEGTIDPEVDGEGFRSDFARLKKIVARAAS